MSINFKDIVLNQQKGLSAILDNAQVTVAQDGQSVALFSVLDAKDAEILFKAAAQLDDCEPDIQEQDLSDASETRALLPEFR